MNPKVSFAISLIQKYEPENGYHLAFSGGKDSIVVCDLAKRAKVRFKAYFYVGGNEPPEVYSFIRKNYPDVKWLYSKYSFTKLIRMKGYLPTRKFRFCCAYIKERWGKGEMVLTGLRRDESSKRRNYQYIMQPRHGVKRTWVNPILDWTEKDVWNYIRTNNLPYCKLYDETPLTRIGCVFCPFAKPELLRWAKERYPQLWNGIRKALKDALKEKPDPVFGTNVDMYLDWWISQKPLKEFLLEQRQLKLF